MATIVKVNAGSCSFVTELRVESIDPSRVHVHVISKCEMITQWGNDLGTIDWKENFKNIKESSVLQCAFERIGHVACPVPIALLKAIEVEQGIATKADVTITFCEDDTG